MIEDLVELELMDVHLLSLSSRHDRSSSGLRAHIGLGQELLRRSSEKPGVNLQIEAMLALHQNGFLYSDGLLASIGTALGLLAEDLLLIGQHYFQVLHTLLGFQAHGS
jgi:hypothetical protein